MVNFVDFRWEEGAALQVRQWREVGIVGKEGLQLEPGRLGLDVREVGAGELGTAKAWSFEH